MPEPIDFANPKRPIHVGVILLGGVTEMLDVGPVDLLSAISTSFVKHMPDFIMPPELKDQSIDFDFHWVSETGKTPSLLTSNLSVVPTDSFKTCPPLDIVIMGAVWIDEPSDAEKAFMKKSYADCSAFITVCGGMQAPLKAGIFDGKTATAPRFHLQTLRKVAPDTNWVDQRWVNDGKLWSSGALLNGIELMSAFIQQTWPSGEGSLVREMMEKGDWISRDQYYRDVKE
ncbi:class I glutamine amidotransferase-like protein [Trichoderma velutinum]